METPNSTDNNNGPVNRTISVIEESASIDKHMQEACRITVSKSIVEADEVVSGMLERERYNIERVTKNEPVAAGYQTIRYEGNTIVISVIEERAAIEKKLFLVEEIRLVRKNEQVEFTEPLKLRKEIVTVKRDSGIEEK